MESIVETIFLAVLGIIATFGIFLVLSIAVFLLRIVIEYLFEE